MAKIRINMDKAKGIWRNQWREARKPQLEAADLEFVQALEKIVEKMPHSPEVAAAKAVIDKKRALRDVTLTDLSGVNTPDALKQVWPSALGSKPEKGKP